MQQIKSTIFNLGLLTSSVVIGLVLIEIGLRLFFSVTDVPYFHYDSDVGNHLAPNQRGVETIGPFAEGSGQYRVNADGWNSVHDYERTRLPNTLRIAVIGDSFVENLAVDVDKLFPTVAEQLLQQDPRCGRFNKIVAYSFGIAGVPMAHYADIMLYARKTFAPDAYVVLIYPGNDFDLSVRPLGSDATFHHTIYEATSDGEFRRIEHVPYEPSSLRRLLSKLATVRYLYGNLQFKSLPALQRLGLTADPSTSIGLIEPKIIQRFTDYIFDQYKNIADSKPLLIMVDADRRAIYSASTRPQFARYIYYASEAATKNGIDQLLLESVFKRDYLENGAKFEFESDEHWNVRANQLVGKALAVWGIDQLCRE